MKNYESIDILCSKISSCIISEEMNIESLCDDMLNIDIRYNEYNELKEAISIIAGDCSDDTKWYIINKTQERYIRYLTHINIWEQDCKSCLYLRDKIIEYVNIPIVNFQSVCSKFELMRQIDLDIIKII
jgi:hypothetical protein